MRGACLCLLLFLPASAAAAGYADLGKLEREAVDDALALRALTIEPAPQGKIIGAVQVVNLDVFLARERVPLVWANIFHRTTREHHIRRESLLQAGDRYDQDLAEETTRNLQDPTLSNVVAVLPVKSATPGMVDLLIVTRDVWSLRFNQDFEAQQNSLLYYTASLSENNLFGWRKYVAAVFVMDQGKMSMGPNYSDPNILGTRLKLQAAFYWIWKRQPDELRQGRAKAPRRFFTWSIHFGRWHAAGAPLRTSVTSTASTANSMEPNSRRPGLPLRLGVPAAHDGLAAAVTRSFPRPTLIQRISSATS